MGTYWHVAHDSYRDGTPLVCRNLQATLDIETPWKWDRADDGFDGGVICLFPDTPQGRTEADWLWYEHPGYVLLRVDIDEDGYDMTVVEEGYPAVLGEIDPEDITVVRRGYANRVIGEDGATASPGAES